jgi:hypothetical protein
MMRDLANNLDLKRGLSPKAAITDNTAYVSEILDIRGLRGAVFAALIGANTDADATFAVLVEDGDAANLSDAAAVADEYLTGTESLAGFTAADDDNEIRKIGYVGYKRYVRVTITPSGNNSGNIFIAGCWITEPMSKPSANPPA